MDNISITVVIIKENSDNTRYIFILFFNICIFKCYCAPFLNISDVYRISYQVAVPT